HPASLRCIFENSAGEFRRRRPLPFPSQVRQPGSLRPTIPQTSIAYFLRPERLAIDGPPRPAQRLPANTTSLQLSRFGYETRKYNKTTGNGVVWQFGDKRINLLIGRCGICILVLEYL